MEFADTQRPYLYNYDLVAQLDGFFGDVADRADQYAFISATERRCFNLAYKLMEDPARQRLVSNSGLLLQHRFLAEAYVNKGTFPKILLMDDLLVHGRGLGKFLHQLEDVLEADIATLKGSPDPGDFRRKLTQSIDILIFARCDKPVLLDERYLDCVQEYLVLPSKKIHDLSLQLSDALTRFELANTCFVYSCDMGGMQLSGPIGQWKKIDWQYQREKMVVYIRFFGSGRVSTIRSFVGRYTNRNAPLYTSFTMLGNLPASVLDRCVNDLTNILGQASSNYTYICSILRDDAALIRSAKTQLLCFLCSVIDFQEFCQEMETVFSSGWSDDLDKISRNFGLHSAVYPEMQRLIHDQACLKAIKDAIYPVLDTGIESLGFPALCPAIDVQQDRVNSRIRDIFYDIGMASEIMAVQYTDAIYRFLPSAYQSYDGQLNLKSSDGVLSIRDFNTIADDDSELSDPYGRVAGFIAAMDCGIMGARVQGSYLGDTEFMLCKAGELSVAYGPEQLAVALPAFEILERFSRRIDMDPLKAILEFCDSLSEETMRSFLSEAYYSRINELRQSYPGLIENIPEIAKKYCPIMYQAGHRIRDWNFENITTKPNRGWMTYQWYLQKKALDFLAIRNA